MKHRKEGRVGVGPDSMGSSPPPPLPPQPATTTPSSSTATPSKRPHKEKELEKRFACTQCPKRFPTSKDLKRHDVVHTGNREFQCSFCTHRFGRKDHRMRHEKKTHAAELLLLEQQQQQQQQSSTSGSSKPANSTQHKSPVQKTSPDGAVGAGVLSTGVCRGATAPKRPRFRHVSSPSVFRSPPVTSGQADLDPTASAAAAAAAASPPIGPFRNMNMSSPPSNSHTLAVAKEEEANLILVKSEDQTDFLAELDITQCQQQQSHQQLLLGHEFKREIKEEPDVFDDSPTTTNQLNSFIEQTPPSLFSIHHQQQPPTTDQSNFVTLVGPNSSPAVVTSSTAEHQFNNSSSRCSSSLSDSLRSFLSKDRNIGSVKSEMESGQAVASALVTTDSTVNDTNEMMRVFEDFEAASSAMDCESVSDGGGGGAGLSVSVPAVFGGGSGVGIALRGERETQNVTTDGAAPASVILRSNTETGVLRMTTQQQHATEPLVIYRQHQAAPSLPVQREPISHQYSFSGFSPLETTTPSSPSYASSVGAARVATSPITDQPMSPGGSSGSGGGSGSTAGGSSLSSGNTGHSGCSVSTSDLLTRTKNPVLPSIYIDNSLIVPEPTKTKYQSSSSSGLHHGVSASDCPLFPPDLDEDDVDTFLRHAAASAAATPSAEGGGGREINDSFFNINTIN